jgi:hypothetical protein
MTFGSAFSHLITRGNIVPVPKGLVRMIASSGRAPVLAATLLVIYYTVTE